MTIKIGTTRSLLCYEISVLPFDNISMCSYFYDRLLTRKHHAQCYIFRAFILGELYAHIT